MKSASLLSLLTGLACCSAFSSGARADLIVPVAASPFTGPVQTKPGFPSPQGDYRPFNTSLDLAYQGNGFAQAAVAKDTIPGFPAIHQAQFANDGFYGNGASWIGNSPNSWLKIDLGRVALVDSVLFGRDRVFGFDDRDPGQFTIAVALTDNVYLNGNDSNDSLEFATVFNSTAAGYNGLVNGAQTLSAIFSAPVSARYVKITFANSGTAIDEIEVRGTLSSVPEPATLLLAGIGTCIAARAGRRRRSV